MPRHPLSSILTRAGVGMRTPPTIGLPRKRRPLLKWSAAVITAMVIALLGTISGASHAEDVNISNRRNSERTSFTNEEIRDGFFKIAFDAELQLGRRVGRIRKFDEPIRVFGLGQEYAKR